VKTGPGPQRGRMVAGGLGELAETLASPGRQRLVGSSYCPRAWFVGCGADLVDAVG